MLQNNYNMIGAHMW